MKAFFKELMKFKKTVFAIIFLSTVTAIGTMLIPAIMQELIDVAVPKKDFGLIFIIAGRMLICVAIVLGSGLINSKLCANVAMGVGANMRHEVFCKVQTFSLYEIDKFSTSSLISRSNSDINVVQSFMSDCFRIAVLSPILCIVGLVMSFLTSVTLSIVIAIAIPILAVIVWIVGHNAIPLSNEMEEKLDEINMIIREKLTGVRVIRAFGTNDFEDKRFDKVNVEYTKINEKLFYIMNVIRPIIDIILGATIMAILLVAFVLHSKGQAVYTTGTIMALIQYVMLIMVSVTIMTIVLLFFPKAATCAKRASEVLASKNEIVDAENPKAINEKKGYVTFKNVTFAYKGADVPAVNNLSFEAKPGETTAIIGGTGMGKSSIVNLIPRLYDVTSGEVLVDDINVKDYTLSDLRSKIGMVPQKSLLFKGTVDSNLSFGGDNPSDERVEEAAKIAQAYDFIMKKKEGFDAPVAQGGTNFSGGQKQRLCIARAVVRKPEIYIFDDSFSALDLKTDKNLREALKKETGKDATTIIVAQRVSTIMDADRIIVVDEGKVVGIGKHDELVGNCPVYREIVESQMSKEDMAK